jgi:hypothetical protein
MPAMIAKCFSEIAESIIAYLFLFWQLQGNVTGGQA